MNEIRTVKTAFIKVESTGDGHQFFRLPEGFELPEGEFQIMLMGDRLTVEPAKPRLTLEEALARMVPLSEDEWPDIDDSDLGPLRDIEL